MEKGEVVSIFLTSVAGEPMADDLTVLNSELKTLLSTGMEIADKDRKRAEAAE